MEWKSINDELPEPDRLIIYGNSAGVEVMIVRSNYMKLFKRIFYCHYVTHWAYVDLPPKVEGSHL